MWHTENPDMRDIYLVTVDVEGYRFVTTDHYNGDGKWTTHNKKHEKVVAWQYLPECYKKEGDTT